MALFAFFLSAAVGGGGVVALRERPRSAAAVGLLATAACLLAAVAMPDGATLGVGSTTLEADPYVRLFLVAAALALLVSQVVGLAHGWQRELPLATLGGLGLVGVALTVGTPAAAMLAVAAAGTFVVIASLERAISMPAVRAAANGFRLAVVAGFMGLVAIAITGDDPIFVPPDVLAGATLLMAAAVAIRVGAIPLHAPVARLIERARTAALPLLAAWMPAAFAVVALGWTSTLMALGATTPIVVVVVAFGVLTIALASAVVLIDDDLVRWLGYGVIADGGFVLLALAGDSATTVAAGLAWLVCFALARSIMACVLLGFQGAFDARRTRELEGWLRRTPLLGAALLAALVVGFGLPGTLSWQVRLDLAQGALGETFGAALVAVALLPLVPVARLAWAGIRPPGDLVVAGTSERFRLPARTTDDAGPALDAQVEPPADAHPAAEPGETATVTQETREHDEPTDEALQAAEPAPAVASDPVELGVDGATAAPWSADAAPDSLWASPRGQAATDGLRTPDESGNAGVADAGKPGSEPGKADAAPDVAPTREATPAASAPGAEQAPAIEARPATTLSSRGRATRAARKASPPTVVGPAGQEAGDSSGGDEGPAVTPGDATPAGSTGPSRRASALAGLRRSGASARASAGPLRHALRDLPAIWALDRTLIASLATLILALVGLAFATDLVGLGAAAGLGASATPAP